MSSDDSFREPADGSESEMERAMGRRMKKREFERAYAERSHVTVRWLHAHGRRAFPCACGEEGCEGWQMVNAALYWEDRWLRGGRWWMWVLSKLYRVR